MADLLDLSAAEQRAWFRLRDGNDRAVYDVEIDGKRKPGCLFKPAFIGTGGGRRNFRRWLARLLQDRHDNDRAHVVAALLKLRNDR
jgi:hypothetical protein